MTADVSGNSNAFKNQHLPKHFGKMASGHLLIVTVMIANLGYHYITIARHSDNDMEPSLSHSPTIKILHVNY